MSGATKLTVDRAETNIEQEFDTRLKQCAPDLPQPLSNFRFDLPDTAREIDRYWADGAVGVELQGGTWSTSKRGHNRGSLMTKDYLKLMRAHERGIKLFFISSDMLRKDPQAIFDTLRKFICIPFTDEELFSSKAYE